MNRTSLLASALAAATLCVPLAAHAQTTYAGNGATGFGGLLGNGSFTVNSTQTSATDGTITFTFNPSGGFTGNSVIVYIDSKTGGIANTSNLTDVGDDGRRGISGEQPGTPGGPDNGNASRTLVNFASGFGADYGISFENTSFNGVFSLPMDTSALTYITGQGPNQGPGGADIVTVNYSQLGLLPGQSLRFVATLIDGTSAYRSNETVGTSTTTVGDFGGTVNAGFTGTQTFSTSNLFTTAGPAPAPEPSGTLALLVGALALGGLALARRRTVVA